MSDKLVYVFGLAADLDGFSTAVTYAGIQVSFQSIRAIMNTVMTVNTDRDSALVTAVMITLPPLREEGPEEFLGVLQKLRDRSREVIREAGRRKSGSDEARGDSSEGSSECADC
ncbi:hypothetical protein [Gordonia sp. (in: high G+C Gram-positive bacteria)]|uniref:hypothetical protein n=1 Tax=Gordonia sp. (in: high G+C Gram-positive bacteria) TaxID=84139 RepID=UPI00333ECE31